MHAPLWTGVHALCLTRLFLPGCFRTVLAVGKPKRPFCVSGGRNIEPLTVVSLTIITCVLVKQHGINLLAGDLDILHKKGTF